MKEPVFPWLIMGSGNGSKLFYALIYLLFMCLSLISSNQIRH